MISKMFRDERQIVTKSTIVKRFFLREAARVQGSDNNLYCTNGTSLENSFYATGDSIYIERHGSYWKVVENDGRSWKGIEVHGTLWKSLENAGMFHR